MVTNSDKTTYNQVPQRIKFVLNEQNGAIVAKVCRSGNVNYLGDCNNEKEQDDTESESQGTELRPVAFADFTSKNGWEEYHVDKF